MEEKVNEVEGRETKGRAGWGGGGEGSSTLFGSFRGSLLDLSGISFHAILVLAQNEASGASIRP